MSKISPETEKMKSAGTSEGTVLLCGFRIGDGFYAIPVLEVQEVVKPQMLTPVPLAPEYIDGLINLRGQIVTSINMRKLFDIKGETPEDYMNIIVRSQDGLYSLVVDEILDVMDVERRSFEETPESLDEKIKQNINGVYKLKDTLLIQLSLEKLLEMEK